MGPLPPLCRRVVCSFRASVTSPIGATLIALMLAVLPSAIMAEDYYISPHGDDAHSGAKAQPWKTIQHAANLLQPGDTAHVLPGTYAEKVTVQASGSAEKGWVTFVAEGPVIVTGKNVLGENIFRMQSKNYVRLKGFEICDNLQVRDGSGIRVQGACDHIELIDNRIHDIRGQDAMGITIYGNSADTPISHLVIQGNTIFDCEPAKSEALTLNGNIDGFQILNNVVRDVNNIGICMIGGEKWINRDRSHVTRNGLCKGNKVIHARSSYGGGYAGGIYVDGGSNIVIEDNEVTGSDLGIEVGAENFGTVTRGIVVRNNRIYLNDKAGIATGGYETKAGRVEECLFEGNICYHNDRHKDANGELWIQLASKCHFERNTLWAGAEGPLVQAVKGAVENTLDNNLYYADSGIREAPFNWHDKDVEGFETFRRISQQDVHTHFAKPAFRAPERGDFSAP